MFWVCLMKKLLTLSILSSLVLTACEKKKDAEYYFNNPDELRTVIQQCEAKMEDIMKKYTLSKEINSDEELAQTRKNVDDAIVALEGYKKDQVCAEAMVAGVGIRLNNLKQAQLEYTDLFVKSVDDKISSFRKSLDRLEKRYESQKELLEKEKAYEALPFDELTKTYSEMSCFLSSADDCILAEKIWKNKRDAELDKQFIEPILQASSDEVWGIFEEKYREINELQSSFCNKGYNPVCSYYRDVFTYQFDQLYPPRSVLYQYFDNHNDVLKAEYNRCYESVSKHKQFTEARMKARNEYPCNYIRHLAYNLTKNLSYSDYDKPME